MIIEAEADLQGMKKVASVVGETLKRMREHAKVGMSTKELDDFGAEILQSYGAESAPIREYDFPGWTCISINDAAAHGVPSDKLILQEGDMVNIDVSAVLDGYFGDNGGSFILGEDLQGLSPLVEASREILQKAISKIKGGVRIGDLGAFIEKQAKRKGYTTLRNLTGHGIGKTLHEEPRYIYNYAEKEEKRRFRKGMVVAVETFISTGARIVREIEDGWTLKADDGSFVAQHEHTLLITDKAPEILTLNNGIFD